MERAADGLDDKGRLVARLETDVASVLATTEPSDEDTDDTERDAGAELSAVDTTAEGLGSDRKLEVAVPIEESAGVENVADWLPPSVDITVLLTEDEDSRDELCDSGIGETEEVAT